MKTLLIDIETYSSVDISACGSYKYIESGDFEILLFAYSIDDAPAVIVDLASGCPIPDDIRHACYDPTVLKIAHNMVFEITALSKHFGQPLDVCQWQDTMALSAYLGLPLSLAQLGEVLRLTQKKLASGTRLINMFSKPNSKGLRVMPADKPQQWEDFKAYCLRDVDTETEVYRKVRNRVPIPQWERELQLADYAINKRGVRIDMKLASSALGMWERTERDLMTELSRITGLENPNSVKQLLAWLNTRGANLKGLDKLSVEDALKQPYMTGSARRVLELRKELGKTSIKKYASMLMCAASDGRAHGITQYYGTFTGRFAGRLIQTQNLPQNHIEDLGVARSYVERNDYEGMEICFDSIADTLSQLVRTALIPSDGNIFHICDFSAIECRVLAWLAGERWVLDVFRNGGDIYCATASQMFGVPVEKHGQNSHLRQKGKVATLACGYGGGVNALKAMGGERMGLSETDMKDTLFKWRKANPNIVKLWESLDTAAKSTIVTGQPHTVNRYITFSMHWGFLIATLPSGRSVCYPRARVESEDGKEQIVYERLNQVTRRWETGRTYGGKLAENCTQAIARDILATVILRCEKAGLPIVFHVHDEVIVDSPKDRTLAEVERMFSEPIPWCPGLPLKGAGYSGDYYFKE